MNLKNCRVLHSTLSTLLILQMAVLVPAAQAMDPFGVPVPGQKTSMPAPVEAAPVDLRDIQPASSATPTAAPGSDETKAYCYNHKSEQDDKNAANQWAGQFNARRTNHRTVAKVSPELLSDQNAIKDWLWTITTDQESGICALRRVADVQVNKLKTIQSNASGENSCDRTKELNDTIRWAAIYEHNYTRAVRLLRLGSKGGKDQQPVKGLIAKYLASAKGNWRAIAAAKQKMTGQPTLTPSLEEEFGGIWGNNAQNQTEASLQKVSGSKAVFAEILDKLAYEQKNAERLHAELTGYNTALSTKFQSCNLPDPLVSAEGGTAILKGQPKPNNLPIVDPDDPGDVSSGDGTETNEEKIKRLRKAPPNESLEGKVERMSQLKEALEKKRQDEAKLKGYTNAVDRLDGNTDPTDTPDPKANPVRAARLNGKKAPDETPDEPLRPLRLDNPDSRGDSTASNFLSNNAGLLVGGALVVGGGVGLYYWDKSEKKKKQDEWDAYWASVNGSASTSTSTSTDTTRRLTIRSAVNNAIVGVILPPIAVAITDAAGNTLTGQDTDVTVSCVNPIPCTLTGTTQVRSVSGVATFSDIKFTAPHVGVRLRYSTTFGGLEQSNGFDVTTTASTVTNTTTNTNTSTSTDTRQ